MNNNFIRSNQNKNNNNRNRNRNNNNNRRNTGGTGGGGPNNKVFDSNGPDIKLRGTTQTIAEKYMQLGRDAQSSGDTVAAENYYQHAEHYYRLWAASQPIGHSLLMPRKLGEEEFDDEGDEQGAAEEEGEGVQGEVAQADAGQVPDAASGDVNANVADGQQPRQNRNNNNRDNNNRNFRPRWPNNNRNNRNYENRDAAGEQAPAAATESSAESVPAPAPAPPAAESDGQWEAPSFLQRPTPAVVEAPEVVAVSEEAPAPRKPRARKPRVEAEAQPVETSGNPE